MRVDWTAVAALAAGIAAIAGLLTAVIYARMLKIMGRDLGLRQRPYLFVDRLNAKWIGTGIPPKDTDRIRPSKAAEAPDLRVENWIYLRNAGPVPARMKPLQVEYRIDGELLPSGVTTTRVAALFPAQQAHNIATFADQRLAQVLRGESVLTLRIRTEYDHIDAGTAHRYHSDIVLRYVINEENLWACSWDYDDASGS